MWFAVWLEWTDWTPWTASKCKLRWQSSCWLVDVSFPDAIPSAIPGAIPDVVPDVVPGTFRVICVFVVLVVVVDVVVIVVVAVVASSSEPLRDELLDRWSKLGVISLSTSKASSVSHAECIKLRAPRARRWNRGRRVDDVDSDLSRKRDETQTVGRSKCHCVCCQFGGHFGVILQFTVKIAIQMRVSKGDRALNDGLWIIVNGINVNVLILWTNECSFRDIMRIDTKRQFTTTFFTRRFRMDGMDTMVGTCRFGRWFVFHRLCVAGIQRVVLLTGNLCEISLDTQLAY